MVVAHLGSCYCCIFNWNLEKVENKMNRRPPRYIWFPLAVVCAVIPAGFFWVNWSKSGSGAGLYSHKWTPEPIFAYWSPSDFYASVGTVEGTFEGEQCVTCHTGITPGIVKDWKSSRHAAKNVYCGDCHGSSHKNLHPPTPEICGECHQKQHEEFEDDKRFGFPGHSLAMERAIDSNHFVDKPKAEVTACLQCHSVATKCDSCHTRHKFQASEARRSEACITCHSGPPHPDDETYFNSKHGQIYLSEGKNWDWTKPLAKGNYKTPTCAYCHMDRGKHRVADKSIWKFGIVEINPRQSNNEIKRQKWIELCSDCHSAELAEKTLRALDSERKTSWKKLYSAEKILKNLRSDGLFFPSAKERPPHPNDWMDLYMPRERIGFYDAQASAFYNVSVIERDYFEMWYFDNLSSYKGAAHNDPSFVKEGHERMDRKLESIRRDAYELERLRDAETKQKIKTDPGRLFFSGEYTEYNKENN